MEMTRHVRAQGYLIEIRVRGIMYLRIERVPRWFVSGSAAALSAVVSGWVLARR
jgi:hypothetical protein